MLNCIPNVYLTVDNQKKSSYMGNLQIMTQNIVTSTINGKTVNRVEDWRKAEHVAPAKLCDLEWKVTFHSNPILLWVLDRKIYPIVV